MDLNTVTQWFSMAFGATLGMIAGAAVIVVGLLLLFVLLSDLSAGRSRLEDGLSDAETNASLTW